MTLPLCHTILPHGHSPQRITLGYGDRFFRRRVLTCDDGMRVLVDLAQTTSLPPGGALLLDDGRQIEIRAAPEPLVRVSGPDLVRLAWHIGNRHTPCQIAPDHLLIQRDPVLEHMLRDHLGADVSAVIAPFTPEGGAYGHGRTHGHSHGHSHGHDRGHDHE